MTLSIFDYHLVMLFQGLKPALLGIALAGLLWVSSSTGQETGRIPQIQELQERYREAVEENERLKQALEAARAELAMLKRSLQRPEQAVAYRETIERVGRLIEAQPENAELYKTRGIAFRALGDYGQSIQDLNRAILLQPSDAVLYNERGTAHFLSRDLKGAQQDFSKAISLNPELAEAYHNRAVIARSLGDYGRAVQDLRMAEKLGVKQAEQTLTAVTGEVVAIQRRLDQLGFEPGPADGIPGPRTDAAVRRLQRKAGLEPTGKVDTTTKSVLRTLQRRFRTASTEAVPRLLEKPSLEYPPAARERGWEGTVALEIELLKNGRVGKVQVKKSSGHQILDDAAIESVRSWRHQPAKENGVPVTRTIEFNIEFKLDEKAQKP